MFFRTLLAVLALCCCFTLSAQKTGERVKNRAENRANQRVDRQVDQAVDEAFNAVGNLFKKKNKNKDKPATPSSQTDRTRDRAPETDATDDDQQARDLMGSLFGGGKDYEPYRNETSFSLTMETTETKRNGKTESNTMMIGALPTQSAFRIIDGGKKQEHAQMIFDTQTGKTTLVSIEDGQRQATRMRMPSFGNLAQRELDKQEFTAKVTKTSETRTISGYRCTKYLFEDPANDISGESWITQDIDLDHAQVFGVMTATFGGGGMQMPEELDAITDSGFPVQSTSTDKKGTTTTMTMTDVKVGEANVNRDLFDLTGVPVQEIGGF